MNRRGFFARMALVGAGLLVPRVLPVDFIQWAPTPPVGATFVSLEAMTMHVASRLHLELAGLRSRSTEAEQTLGNSGIHQFSIEVLLADGRDVSVEQYLDPAAASLADKLRGVGAVELGRLTLPKSCDAACIVRDDRIAVRGIQQYDIGWHGEPGMRTRFDVLVTA